MKLFYRCEDCGKNLIYGVHTFYEHPLYDNKYVCSDCNVKYFKYRNKLFTESIDKAYNNVIDDFNNFIKSNTEESDDDNTKQLDCSVAKDKLKKLKTLYEDEVLSKQEYEKAKDEILKRL